MSTRSNSLWVTLAVLVLLIVGLVLRLYNINWDDNHHLHPDERFITTVAMVTALPAQLFDILDPRRSPLNPYWDLGSGQPRRFAYGSFPLYLVRVTATTAAMIGAIMPGLSGWVQANDYDHLNLVGRVLSALFDSITIGLIFLLGRRIFNEKVGLIAAALVTFTVQNIQLAHFYAFDTVTTTTIVAALYFGVRVVQDGQLGDSLALGAMVALAIASKFSALPLLMVIVLAHGLRPILSIGATRVARPAGALGAVANPPLLFTGEVSVEINRAIGRILVSLLTAIVVFVVVSPFTLLDFAGYASSISEQSDMVRGILDYPYTRQYRNTGIDYWFNNLVFWGMGPALGLAGLAGLLLLVARLVKRTSTPAEILVLAWVLPYGLITISFQVKFMRYLLPVTPFLCLTAGYLLWRLASFDTSQMRRSVDEPRVQSGEWRVARGLSNGSSRFAVILRKVIVVVPLIIVLVATVAYALAFMNIYSEPVTRVRASDWIYRNIPPGSTITDEVWDDSLPLGQVVDGRPRSLSEYKVVDMNLVEADDAKKLSNLHTWLNAADYVILSSNRMYG